MHVISLKTLRRFWTQHPDAEEYLKTWHRKAEHSNWENPQQVKVDYPNASIISGDRVIFQCPGQQLSLGGAYPLPSEGSLCAVYRHSRRIRPH